MSDANDPFRARLVELRDGFDRAFSEPVATPGGECLELLAIRVGEQPYALRSGDIAAVEVDRRISQAPSEDARLLGIAAVRGAIFAVYDLASLLGHPRMDGPRWLVLAKSAPVAFAFSAFEGQLRVEEAALARPSAGFSEHLAHVMAGGVPRPVVDVARLITVLEDQALAGKKRESR